MQTVPNSTARVPGFTSRDFEIYQSNTLSFRQFRFRDEGYPMVDHLAFPGKGRTWMLLSFLKNDDVDAETTWYYINRIMEEKVFTLE